MAHLRDGEQLGVAAGRCGAWPRRDGNGPGRDRVIDQDIDIDEQVLGWQHGSGLCETRHFDNRLSLAGAIS
jgi:hypothetical protein